MNTAMNQSQIIELAKEFAEANYEYGMSYFIECYEYKEWVDYVGSDTLMGTLSRMVKNSQDRQEETGGNPFKSN